MPRNYAKLTCFGVFLREGFSVELSLCLRLLYWLCLKMFVFERIFTITWNCLKAYLQSLGNNRTNDMNCLNRNTFAGRASVLIFNKEAFFGVFGEDGRVVLSLRCFFIRLRLRLRTCLLILLLLLCLLLVLLQTSLSVYRYFAFSTKRTLSNINMLLQTYIPIWQARLRWPLRHLCEKKKKKKEKE